MKGLGGSPLPREQAYVAFLFPHGDHADLSALANMAVLREEIIVSSHLKNFAEKDVVCVRHVTHTEGDPMCSWAPLAAFTRDR